MTRKGRLSSEAFLVEGIRHVASLLASDFEVNYLVVSPDLLTSSIAWELVSTFRSQGGTCLTVTGEVFALISSRDNPQGIAAVARSRIVPLSALKAREADVWVALCQPQDPGNVGTILRTCDAVGAGGIILLDGGVDPYHPSAIRAAAGATFSCRIVRATTTEFLDWSLRTGCFLVGTSDAAGCDYRDTVVDADIPKVLVMGSERQGIPESLVPSLHRVVSIPMAGMCDSLNLAVATSIMLYELARHQAAGLAPTRGLTDA